MMRGKEKFSYLMNLFIKKKYIYSKAAYSVLVENYTKRLRVGLVDVVVRNNTKT